MPLSWPVVNSYTAKFERSIAAKLIRNQSTNNDNNTNQFKDERLKFSDSPKIVVESSASTHYNTVDQNNTKLYITHNIFNINKTLPKEPNLNAKTYSSKISGTKNQFCNGPKMIKFRTKQNEDEYITEKSIKSDSIGKETNILTKYVNKLQNKKTEQSTKSHTRFCSGPTMISPKANAQDSVKLETNKNENTLDCIKPEPISNCGSTDPINKCKAPSKEFQQQNKYKFCSGPAIISHQPTTNDLSIKSSPETKIIDKGNCLTLDEREKISGEQLRIKTTMNEQNDLKVNRCESTKQSTIPIMNNCTNECKETKSKNGSKLKQDKNTAINKAKEFCSSICGKSAKDTKETLMDTSKGPFKGQKMNYSISTKKSFSEPKVKFSTATENVNIDKSQQVPSAGNCSSCHCCNKGKKKSNIFAFFTRILGFVTKIGVAGACVLLTVEAGVWHSPDYPKTSLEVVQEECSRMHNDVVMFLDKFKNK